MALEQQAHQDLLIDSRKTISRRRFLSALVPRNIGKQETEKSKDSPTEFASVIQDKLQLKAERRGVILAAGAWAFLHFVPGEHTIPHLATENQKKYRVPTTPLAPRQESVAAHRTGNSTRNTIRAADSGFDTVDIDIEKVDGPFGNYYAWHGEQFAAFGIPIAGYDRSSSKFRLFSPARTLDKALKTVKDERISAIAELKRGNFSGKDVVKIRRKASDYDVNLVLHSNDYNLVKDAARKTHDLLACFFRPKNDSEALEASGQGYALFIDFGMAIRNSAELKKNGTIMIVGGVTTRTQIEELKTLNLNVKSYFGDAPDIERLYSQS